MTSSPSDLRPGEPERLAFWLRHAPAEAWLIALYDEPSVPQELSESLCDMPCLTIPLTPKAAGSLSRLPGDVRGVVSTWGLVASRGAAGEALDSLRAARQDPLHVLLLWLTLEERQVVLDTAPTLWSRSSGYFDLRLGWADASDPRPLSPIRYSDWSDLERQIDFVEQVLAEHRQSEDPLSELGLELASRLSRLYFAAREYQQAERVSQELLEIAQSQQDKPGMASATNDLGLCRYIEGKFQEAIEHYQRARVLYHAAGAVAAEAVALSNLGAAHRDGGDRSQARHLFEEALALVESVGDRWVEATILNQLGGFYRKAGDEGRALDSFSRALPLRREVGDRSGEATTLVNLASVHADREEFEQAQQAYERALVVERGMGDRRNEALILNKLGLLSSRQADEAQALEHYQRALRIWQDLDDRHNQAIVLNNIGVAYYNIALRRYQERILDSLKFEAPVTPAPDASSQQVEIESAPEDLERASAMEEAALEAMDAYREALSIRQELEDQEGAARLLSSMGKICHLMEEYGLAMADYFQALNLWRALDDRFMQAQMWVRIAKAQAAQDEGEGALSIGDRAFAILETVEPHPEMADLLNTLGSLYEEQSAPERAVACYRWAFQIGLESDALNMLPLYKIRDIDLPQALDLASQGLERQRARGRRADQARLLATLGNLRRFGEQHALALDDYTEALELCRELGEREIEARVVGSLANMYDRMGQREEALEGYAQAAAIWRGLGNLMGEGHVLNLMIMALQFAQPPEYERLFAVLERKIEVDGALGMSTAGWEQMRDLWRQMAERKEEEDQSAPRES